MSRAMIWRAAALVAVGMVVGCSGGQRRGPSSGDTPPDESETTPDGGEPEAEAVAGGAPLAGSRTAAVVSDPPVCRAYRNGAEVDPLRRWIGAFPIRMGGVVLVFPGTETEQMEIEAVLEMAGVAGYEDQTCGDRVVVWIPGAACDDEDRALARQVESGANVALEEATCFRIDEIRQRIREECRRGTISPELCR